MDLQGPKKVYHFIVFIAVSVQIFRLIIFYDSRDRFSILGTQSGL